MIDSIEMSFAYTLSGVHLRKYHQTLCCHWVACLLHFTFDQVVSGPKVVVEESTNVSKRYRARIVVLFSAGHIGVQHVSLVVCSSLLPLFVAESPAWYWRCSRSLSSSTFQERTSSCLRHWVRKVFFDPCFSGSCKLYTPSYIGRISQK